MALQSFAFDRITEVSGSCSRGESDADEACDIRRASGRGVAGSRGWRECRGAAVWSEMQCRLERHARNTRVPRLQEGMHDGGTRRHAGRARGRRQRRRRRKRLARHRGLPRAVPAAPSHKDRTRRLPRLRLGRRGRTEGLRRAPAHRNPRRRQRRRHHRPGRHRHRRFHAQPGSRTDLLRRHLDRLGVVSGLHIHAASNNAIVVPLDADAVLTDGNAKGCVNGIAKNLIKAIRQHPEQYYVNVHTDEFTAGAIRGTLQT